ncbi:hypothetical protein PR202_ga10291 [Eleusine coracana subsp. coracana]|uniref:Uncharacterized protein n=1 Tax=Eleusine coracana subsp. coracana TaxID=191504 RepID=A0AAV5C6F1_ELECO|nr:hypothetical protein PR202_ga10291 [Eleusine coracana subsp. coracana]
MVAGRVKAAMGFQRTPKPAPAPPPESPARTPARPPPLGTASTASTTGSAPSKASALARSFGSYFPRSSAQVRPAASRAPPEVAELLRAIEQLQERESRLRVELLEQKILRETVAIVPFLEAELAAKGGDLARCRERADRLEAENARLCAELDAAVLEAASRKRRILEMEKDMAELVRKQQEAADDCSSSASATNEHHTERPYVPPPPAPPMPPAPLFKSHKSYFSASSSHDVSSSTSPSSSTSTSPTHSSSSSSDAVAVPRTPRVLELSKLPPIPPPPPPCPPPPPPPIHSKRSSSSPSTKTGVNGTPAAAAPPPPPPPPPARRPASAASPRGASGACVRRVPEVVEFYHSLMRRESNKRDGGCGADQTANGGGAAAARDMIGEIENRSAHLLAIKSDVERQGDFIRFLIKEVEGAAFSDIEDVVTFVKWLDDELSRLVYTSARQNLLLEMIRARCGYGVLSQVVRSRVRMQVDERAVLKHFDWPEHKADALREAAFGYCDLKKLEVEAASFRDDARQPCAAALKKMQALFEKLEHGVYNLARVRDAATSRYTRFQIPSEWMQQDAGVVSQFAGGFDVDTMRAFQELKEKASMCRIERQTHSRHMRQQRLVART